MGVRKVRLPPTTREGVDTYFGRRGFRKNPVLGWQERADVAYVKPLPDGRRMHVHVYEFPRHFKIKTHVDQHDPGRDPVGHALVDGPVRRRNQVVKVRKRKSSPSFSEQLGKFFENLFSS